MIRFDYEAQTLDGLVSSGAIDARDLDDALAQLRRLGLRATRIEPHREPAGGAIEGATLSSFNVQLAQATSVGIPVDQAVKLIADEMPSGRTRRTVRALAGELERGADLPQAIERLGRRFPASYVRVLRAGIESNRLPETLTLLASHQALLDRLRSAVWRSAAYPVAVLIGLLVVMTYIGRFVLPQLLSAWAGSPGWKLSGRGRWLQFDPIPSIPTPLVSRIVMDFSVALPYLVAITIVLFVLVPLLVRWSRRAGIALPIVDSLLLRLPVFGNVLRKSLLARFTDGLALAVKAGMDLPAALRTSSEACASRPLSADTSRIIEAIERGQATSDAGRLTVVPRVLTQAIDLSTRHRTLAEALTGIAASYRRQAEASADRAPAVVMPLLMLICLLGIGITIAAVMLPITTTVDMMLSFIQSVSGPR